MVLPFPGAAESRPVSVRGKLVDARTGTPIASAWVMSFPRREWAEDKKLVSEMTAAAERIRASCFSARVSSRAALQEESGSR